MSIRAGSVARDLNNPLTNLLLNAEELEGSITAGDERRRIVEDQRGYLEIAECGTLFLDEVSDLKPEIRAKLLRVLEERKLRRLGSEREIAVDVRILAAAQEEPGQLVKDERLREDLLSAFRG